MRKITKITDNKWMNIYSIVEPENGVKGFEYAERRGKDSIAFICVDKNDPTRILLNKEYKPPLVKFVVGAFGGSLFDSDSKIQTVIHETREECGFIVTEKDIDCVGKVTVSSMMNQYCSLYIVSVDPKKQKEREPENAVEALATVEWVSIFEIFELEDWKPMAIFCKARKAGLLIWRNLKYVQSS